MKRFPQKSGMICLLIFAFAFVLTIPALAAEAPASANKDLCASIPPNQAKLLAGNCESYFVVVDAVGQKMVNEVKKIVESNDHQNPSDVSSTFNSLKAEADSAMGLFRKAVDSAAKTHPVDQKAKLTMDNAIQREIHSLNLAFRIYTDMAKAAAVFRNAELTLADAENSLKKKYRRIAKMGIPVAKTYQHIGKLSQKGGKANHPEAFDRRTDTAVKRMLNSTKVMHRLFSITKRNCDGVLKDTAPDKLRSVIDLAALEKRMDKLVEYKSHWRTWFEPIKAPLNSQAKKVKKAYLLFERKYESVYKGDPFMSLVGEGAPGAPFTQSDPVERIKRAYSWYVEEKRK